MLGCCFHCGYCQNWVSSQALRDFRSEVYFCEASPESIVSLALASHVSAVVSTYNEPLITSEWAVAVFREARAAGLVTGYVSNGNATPEVLEYLRPWLDLFKVDLKTMDDRRYHALGGRLKPVLDSIAAIHALGFWLEVVTLIVPGFNDSSQELDALSRFLAGVSPDIPWHVTAFHRAYKMTEPENASPTDLLRAASIGRDAGLRYVYAGNLEGRVGDLENTRCAACHALLIERCGFRVVENRVTAGGCCPQCGSRIPGFWQPRNAGAGVQNEGILHVRCG
jgi:pyruvate formate lyase activating enzyme